MSGKAASRFYCPVCENQFETVEMDRKYCSRKCMYKARSTWKNDSLLKSRFISEYRKRGMSCASACEEIGLPYATIKSWLKTPNGKLQQRTLTPLASWLGYTVLQATQLQGGTAEEKQRVIALEHLDSDRMKSYLERVKKSPRLRRQQLRQMTDAVRGKPMSEEHRQKISAALKAYRERPGAHELGKHHGSIYGKAQQMLRSLKNHHRDLSPEELQEIAVSRLLQPPYNLGSEVAAHALLAPAKPLRVPHKGGRPPLEERHRIIDELMATWPRTATSKLAKGFWPSAADAVARAEKIEGGYEAEIIRQWFIGHSEVCSKKYATNNVVKFEGHHE